MRTYRLPGRELHVQCRWPFLSLCTGRGCRCRAFDDGSASLVAWACKSFWAFARWPMLGWLIGTTTTLFIGEPKSGWWYVVQFGLLAIIMVFCILLWKYVYKVRVGAVCDDSDEAVTASINRVCRRRDLEFACDMEVERRRLYCLEVAHKALEDAEIRVQEARRANYATVLERAHADSLPREHVTHVSMGQPEMGQPLPPQTGDVMTAPQTGDTVTVTEVAEHWVRCRRPDGTGFTRSKRGFLKHYRQNL